MQKGIGSIKGRAVQSSTTHEKNVEEKLDHTMRCAREGTFKKSCGEEKQHFASRTKVDRNKVP